MPGGPFEHRPDAQGICRVCGYQMPVPDATLLPLCGCPQQVKDMSSYKPRGKPISSEQDATRAASELRALLRGGEARDAP